MEHIPLILHLLLWENLSWIMQGLQKSIRCIKCDHDIHENILFLRSLKPKCILMSNMIFPMAMELIPSPGGALTVSLCLLGPHTSYCIQLTSNNMIIMPLQTRKLVFNSFSVLLNSGWFFWALALSMALVCSAKWEFYFSGPQLYIFAKRFALSLLLLGGNCRKDTDGALQKWGEARASAVSPAVGKGMHTSIHTPVSILALGWGGHHRWITVITFFVMAGPLQQWDM